MSVVEFKIYDSTLLFMGHFKLYEKVQKIRTMMEMVFNDVFIDWSSNWEEIYNVLIMFGCSGLLKNACASKYFYTDAGESAQGAMGDNVKTQYMQKLDMGSLIQISKIFKEKSLLKDENIELTWDLTNSDYTNIEKWKNVCQTFQKVQTLIDELIYMGFMITPLYASTGYLHRSPVQLQMYKSYLMETNVSCPNNFNNDPSVSSLHRIPESATDYAFNDESFQSTLKQDWWINLIGLTLNNSWTFTTETSAMYVDGQVNSVLLPENTVCLERMAVYALPETSACSAYSIEEIDAGAYCPNIEFVGSHNMAQDEPRVSLTTDAKNHLDEFPGGRIDLTYKTISVSAAGG